MLRLKTKRPLFLIALASIFICCKDSKTATKSAMEPSLPNTEATEYAIKTGNVTTNIQKLKDAFKNKNEALFLEQFPSDFQQFMQYFGWNTESNQPNELYEESYAYIDYFFNLLSQDKYRKFESKLVGIAKNGVWQEDGVNYFQDLTLAYIKNGERYGLIEDLTSDEAKSVLFFLFDGPHPKLDTDFASGLSLSKKRILNELFETSFYDANENPDPILDEEGDVMHYNLSNYIGSEHFFIRDIDLDNDGQVDKIVSATPYQSDELLIFVNKGGEYSFALKTTNFSEDGGNQIVDIVAEKNGFIVKTAFPDGGLLEAEHHIAFKENTWMLTHTVYRTQSSNQEDAFIYVCDVQQGLNLTDTDFFDKLKLIPDEAEKNRLCTIERN